MLAYGFGSKENGLFEIENTLEALQGFVDGYIEVLYIGSNLCLVCNEVGKLQDMEYTAALVGDNGEVQDIIAGNCFVLRDDGEGDFESLRNGDVEEIQKYVKAVIAADRGLIILAE